MPKKINIYNSNKDDEEEEKKKSSGGYASQYVARKNGTSTNASSGGYASRYVASKTSAKEPSQSRKTTSTSDAWKRQQSTNGLSGSAQAQSYAKEQQQIRSKLLSSLVPGYAAMSDREIKNKMGANGSNGFQPLNPKDRFQMSMEIAARQAAVDKMNDHLRQHVTGYNAMSNQGAYDAAADYFKKNTPQFLNQYDDNPLRKDRYEDLRTDWRGQALEYLNEAQRSKARYDDNPWAKEDNFWNKDYLAAKEKYENEPEFKEYYDGSRPLTDDERVYYNSRTSGYGSDEDIAVYNYVLQKYGELTAKQLDSLHENLANKKAARESERDFYLDQMTKYATAMQKAGGTGTSGERQTAFGDDYTDEVVDRVFRMDAALSEYRKTHPGEDMSPTRLKVFGASSGSLNVDRDDRVDKWAWATDEERAAVRYLADSGQNEKLVEYVNMMEPELNSRANGEAIKAWTTWSTENVGNAIAASALSVAAAPIKGFAYLGQTLDIAKDGEIDEWADYNMLTRVPDSARNAISQKIGNKWGTWAYQTGMSMGDFLFTALVSGGFSRGAIPEKFAEAMTLSIMGTGAAATATIEAKERGLTDAQAYSLGTIAGLAEVVTEKVSIDRLFKTLNSGDRVTFNTLLKHAFLNAIPEATEEGAADLINNVSDYFIALDQSKFMERVSQLVSEGHPEREAYGIAFGEQAVDTGYSMLGGGVSGFFMGSGALSLAGIQSNNAMRREAESRGVSVKELREQQINDDYLSQIMQNAYEADNVRSDLDRAYADSVWRQMEAGTYNAESDPVLRAAYDRLETEQQIRREGIVSDADRRAQELLGAADFTQNDGSVSLESTQNRGEENGREAYYDNGTERYDSYDSGVEAQRMAEEPGFADRGASAETAQQFRGAEQAPAQRLPARTGQVKSTELLGTKVGVADNTVTIIDTKAENTPAVVRRIEKLSSYLGRDIGTTHYYSGTLYRRGFNDELYEVHGFVDPSTGDVYIGVDDPQRAEKTFRHEVTHLLVAANKISVRKVMDYMKSMDPKAYSDIMTVYASAYAGSGMSLEGIWGEAVADAMAGINIEAREGSMFWNALEEYMPMVRHAVEDIHTITGDVFTEAYHTETDTSQNGTNAPPIYKDILASLGKNAKAQYTKNGDLVIAENADQSTVLYSNRTLSKTQSALAKILFEKGYSDADVKRALNIVSDQAAMLNDIFRETEYSYLGDALDADVHTDIRGRQVLRAIVKNGEYPVNIDFLTICKKRQAYSSLLSKLLNEGIFDQIQFDADAIAMVNEELRNAGFETACLMCFVESRRQQIQKWATTFRDDWNAAVDKALDGKKAGDWNFYKGKRGEYRLTNNEALALSDQFEKASAKLGKNDKENLKLGQGSVPVKMATLLKNMPSLAKHLSTADLLTPEGFENLSRVSPELRSLLLQHYGSNTPKPVQEFTPYNGEIGDLSGNFMAKVVGESIPGLGQLQDAAKKRISAEAMAAFEEQAKLALFRKAYALLDQIEEKRDTDDVDELWKEYKKVNPTKANIKREVNNLVNQWSAEEAIQKYLFDIGGVRLQSFSDYLVENTLDYYQLFADLAAKEFPLHAYTKEITFARLFGMTGAKINLSLIARLNLQSENAGLNPDGTYAGWSDYYNHAVLHPDEYIQSVGYKDAVALMMDPRYSSNVGTIAIGVSPAQIRKMLSDPYIRMVIPYHASGMNPTFAQLMHIDRYRDSTQYQNTSYGQMYDLDGNPVDTLTVGNKEMSGAQLRGTIEKFLWDETLQRVGDPKKAADEYLAWCARRHDVVVDGKVIGQGVYKPMFSGDYAHAENDFTNEENYYKLLENFTTKDAITEENAPQKAVQMLYPNRENVLAGKDLTDYEARLREAKTDTGENLFTEKDIAKYVKWAQQSSEDIIRAEVKSRKEYHDVQDAKLESETYPKIKARLQSDDYRFSADGRRLTDEKQAELFKNTDVIKKDMTDAERYEILKEKSIVVHAKTNPKKIDAIRRKYNADPESIEKLRGSERERLLKKIGDEFKVFKDYSNQEFNLQFTYSRSNMSEALSHQRRNYGDFFKMLSCFDDVIGDAVGIEVHNRNESGYKIDPTLQNCYVFASAFEDDGDVIPVKLEVKEFRDKQNTLYIAITMDGIKMDEVSEQGNDRTNSEGAQVSRSSTIRLADLFNKIKQENDKSFLKYIPKQFFGNNVRYSTEGRTLSDEEQRRALSKVDAARFDSEYEDAYFDGDDDLMQSIIDEAAKKAGYQYKAYHHTENAFTVFDLGKARKSMDIQGFFFSADPDAEREYGSVRYDVYLKMDHPFVIDNSEKFNELMHAVDWSRENAGVRAREWLQERGYDGVIREANFYGAEADEYVVFDSARIKSAEPVTYADDEYGEGEYIPPSERFNESNPDIRYSTEGRGLSDEEQARAIMEGTGSTEEIRSLVYDIKDAVATPKMQKPFDWAEHEAARLSKRLIDQYKKYLKSENVKAARGTVKINDLAPDLQKYVGWMQKQLTDKNNQDRLQTRQGQEEFAKEAKDRASVIASKLINAKTVLTETEQAKADTIEEAKRVLKARVNIDEAYYKKLQNQFGTEFFPDEKDAKAMFDNVRDAVITLSPIYENPYQYYGWDMVEAVDRVAQDIVTQSMSDMASKAVPDALGNEIRNQAEEVRRAAERTVSSAKAAARMRRDKMIRDIQRHAQETQQARRDMREASEERNRLLKIARRLNNKKLPMVTRERLNELIGDLDLVAQKLTKTTRMNLVDLKLWYDDQVANNPDFIADSRIQQKLDRLSKRQIGTAIDASKAEREGTPGLIGMTQEEVRDLTEALLNIENEIAWGKKLIDEQDKREVYYIGKEIIDHVENAVGLHGYFKQRLHRVMVQGALEPYAMIHRVTGYNENDGLYRAEQKLEEGQRIGLDFTRRAYEIFDQAIADEKFMRKFYGQHADEIEISGLNAAGETVKVKITPDQRAALYMHSLNDQNLRHIMNGGLTVPNIKAYKAGRMDYAFDNSTLIRLTPSMVREITSHMTEGERRFCRMAREYYDEMSQKEINAVSLKLKGYELAKVEHYFPINTDRNFRQASYENLTQDGTIEGMGFLKERVEASNAIYLRGIVDVTKQSIRMTAKYVGLAIPVRNFSKLLSVNTGVYETQETYNGEKTVRHPDGSVMNAIAHTWGDGALKYIDKMMTDIQNPRHDEGELVDALRKMRGLYAGAVLNMNLGVAVKQAASYPTAAAVLGWKPLFDAFRRSKSDRVDLDLVAKYTPLLWYRSRGFSSMELGDLAANEGFKLPKALNWIQAVDVMTTKKLWRASEAYVRDNYKDLEIRSDAYYKAVADVYNKVIERTQPNYTTMQRPEFLRSNFFVTSLFMFKTQPFQNFNIAYDAIGNLAAKQRMAKARGFDQQGMKDLKAARTQFRNGVTSLFVAAAVFSSMAGLWAAGRKKYGDDDPDKWWQDLISNFVSALVGGIPGATPIWEALSALIFDSRYYGYETVTEGQLNDLLTNFYNIVNDLADGKGITKKKAKQIAQTVGPFLGIPASNLINVWNAISAWTEGAIPEF